MKKLQRRSKKKQQLDTRITNETVAAHRERILADGKRFKYPHQYLRHKLVINAVIIGLVSLLIASGVAWYQLYIVQNTSDFIYRLTRVVPVSVAEVDDRQVRYSDYLMRYRSQELWLRSQGQLGLNEQDGERQLDFIKRSVMDGLELDVYAAKQADSLGINVKSEEIDAVIDRQRNTSTGRISAEVYDASTRSVYGYSPDEYRHIIEQSILRQKVAYAVDKDAQAVRDIVRQKLAENKDTQLEALAQTLNTEGKTVQFGASGLVPTSNKDGGLTQAALRLKDGEISKPIESNRVDDYGYFFVQKLSSNDRQVSYQYIKVPLTKFVSDFEKMKKANGINEHISLKKVEQQTQPARQGE